MYQFFVEPNQVGTEYISILGDDVNHIKNVLRMKIGTKIRVSVKDELREMNSTPFINQNVQPRKKEEQFPLQELEEKVTNIDVKCLCEEEKFQIVSSKETKSYFGTIDQISENEVLVKIESQDEIGTELSNRIYLFQGLPKGDKMELIIQKAVELGVYEIIPVAMKNCIVKLDDKKSASKVKRWQAISESAAKQSKRTIIPEIKMPLSWKLALKEAEKLDMVLVPYENERGMQATREIMQSIKPGQSIGIFIGPEGGFSQEEIDSIAPIQVFHKKNSMNEIIKENNFIRYEEQVANMDGECSLDTDIVKAENKKEMAKYHRISLGRRILRTETAGLATLSMLVFCLDE